MKSYEYVCKALELARNSQEIFEKSVSVCGDELGREVFSLLMSEGKSQVELIQGISTEMSRGQDFAGACTLDEAETTDMRAALSALVEKHAAPDSCQTELGAAKAAREMVEGSLRFYRDWEAAAQAGVEKEFIERMRGELRAQIGALANLIHYYEDPTGWAYDQELELAPLDGA